MSNIKAPSIKFEGLDKVLAALNPKQVKYATSVALNNTAFQARDDLKTSLHKYFNIKVNSAANRAFKVKKANKNNLVANIYLDEYDGGKGSSSADIFAHHFSGGDRPLKRFEKALVYNGYMTNKQSAIKSKYFKAKMSAGFFNKLLSYLRMHYKAGYSSNMTAKGRAKVEKNGITKKGYKTIRGKAYFVIPNKTKQFKQPGIYQKSGIHGSIIVPVILFVSKANYKKKLDLKEIVGKTVKENYAKNFNKAWNNAIQNAR